MCTLLITVGRNIFDFEGEIFKEKSPTFLEKVKPGVCSSRCPQRCRDVLGKIQNAQLTHGEKDAADGRVQRQASTLTTTGLGRFLSAFCISYCSDTSKKNPSSQTSGTEAFYPENDECGLGPAFLPQASSAP